MNTGPQRAIVLDFLRVRAGLVPLMVFTVLLGIINTQIQNQKVVLYLYYLPVIFAAWKLPKRDAVCVAVLAALMVIAYAIFIPKSMLNTATDKILIWTELGMWGAILIATAYMVSSLRIMTQQAMQDLQNAYTGVLAILSKFIETVDADTEAHSVRVSAWSVQIARQLKLSPGIIEETRIASLLHDVGKIDISVGILRKAASLSDEEQEVVRGHAESGAAMLKPVGGMLSNIADAIEAHHEKFDGTGYNGIAGQDIPLVARIIAVADAFDAMVSDRSYRKGISVFKATDNITSSSGTHFDPQMVKALQRIVNREGERALASALQGAGAMSSESERG